MEHAFAAFLVVVVILELFDLNLKRKMLVKRWQSVVFSMFSTAFLAALFILLGWMASDLLPEMEMHTRVYFGIALLFLLTFYGFRRDKSYSDAGGLAYANFGLFMLIGLGKSILYMIIGLVIGMLGTNEIWFVKSFLFAVIVFGIALFFTHKPLGRVLGIPLPWMKALLYGLSAVFLAYQFILQV